MTPPGLVKGWPVAATLVPPGGVVVACVVAAGAVMAGRVAEAPVLALAVAAGLPHGASDHEVGRRVFARGHGRRWWRPFLGGYLALVAATLLAWWVMPGVALAAFLFLSAIHFGDQDAAPGTGRNLLATLAHGGAVIVVPAACHPVAVERILAIVAPAGAAGIERWLAGPLLVVWLAATVTTLAGYVVGGGRNRARAVDLMMIVMLFAVATPLVAVSLYFAAVHAPRALRSHRAARLPAGRPIVPVALTLLGLLLGAIIFAAGSRLPASDNLIRTAFLLLSALTVPHMWLEARLDAMHDGGGAASTGTSPPARAATHPLLSPA